MKEEWHCISRMTVCVTGRGTFMPLFLVVDVSEVGDAIGIKIEGNSIEFFGCCNLWLQSSDSGKK